MRESMLDADFMFFDAAAGIGTRDDIDTTAMLGFAHPMGPLKLADL